MQAGTLITPRLAEEAIYSRLTCLPIESLPLTQCVGATLRENIYAERDQPPFDRVAMDGMAVDSEALRRGLKRSRVQGIQAAGAPPLRLDGGDLAIEWRAGDGRRSYLTETGVAPPGAQRSDRVHHAVHIARVMAYAMILAGTRVRHCGQRLCVMPRNVCSRSCMVIPSAAKSVL